jgi:precorrin-2 dehydrogenase/sirohydrochlorin ferrochelatase
MAAMETFPAFFPLAGRRVVVVGAGEQADAKARLFEGSPAEIVRLEEDGRALDPEAYRGAALAFIASDEEAFARMAAAAAKEAGAAVNVVDRPELCDFFTPALVDRGEVVAAVGTGGSSPVLAQVLKGALETAVPEGSGRVAALLRQFRVELKAAFPDMAERRRFVLGVLEGPAAEAAMAGDMDEARRLLRTALAAVSRPAVT